MKIPYLTITLLILTLPLTAQLKISGTLGTVGFNQNPSSSVRAALFEDELPVTLKLTTYDDNNAAKTGFYNYMRFGTGEKTGINNYLQHGPGATTDLLGLYNDILPKTSGKATGIENFIRGGTASSLAGIYNFLNTPSSTTAGTRYGLHTLIRGRWDGPTYGSKVRIEEDANATGSDIYGFHAQIIGNATATRYGVHSTATGVNAYAGHFSGAVVVNGSFMNTSDRSLKFDVQDLTASSDVLAALQPRSYRYYGEEEAGVDRIHYGFIAQELEQVLPDLVTTIREPAVVDGEGSILLPAQELRAVRYLDLIALLTASLQEQGRQIDDLNDLLAGTLSATNATGTGKGQAPSSANSLRRENQQLRQQITGLEQKTSVLHAELQDLRNEFQSLRECTDCYDEQPPVLEQGIGTPKKAMSVYPNPATNRVTVNYKTSVPYEITVLDANGRRVKRLNVRTQSRAIDVGNWPAGMYLFIIHEGGAIIGQEKVIVSKRKKK